MAAGVAAVRFAIISCPAGLLPAGGLRAAAGRVRGTRCRPGLRGTAADRVAPHLRLARLRYPGNVRFTGLLLT
jgi:hypothetical protein